MIQENIDLSVKKNTNNILVIDKTNFFKFKLTQKDRRLLKKKFGEKGYKMFLYLNNMGMFSVTDSFDLDIIHHMLINCKDKD